MDNANRPRRSDPTRAAILEAARQRFAHEGYDRTTIRAVAADARIDPSMVIRYYGSKEQLFATAIDVPFRLPRPQEVPADELGATVVRSMFALWERDPVLLARLRRAVTDDDTAAQVRGTIEHDGAALAEPYSADAAEAQLRAGLVATQILGIALCRYILRAPAVAAMDIEELAAWYGPTIQRYLTGPAPERGTPGDGPPSV
ncbi:TetR/AcrR family transcriptional regulator [Glycomyces arizonensis]|uniref:TetR/AcrR family transcriptional regulator n=1 Tax=Glycomyces arizonensis TaxID=256035 RepID=UPI00041BF07F|nr:TetR family transcriptional regulator [Glycomyces arizonensis]